jgi:16S rRNA (cytosine967-C5)-methyltransferase
VGDHAAGFVNAILRRITERAPDPVTADPDVPSPHLIGADSHPEWLVLRWLARFGKQGTEALIRWNDTQPSLVLQPARASLETVADKLSGAGIGFSPAPYGAGLVVEASRPTELPGFAEGDFVVQDPAQALVCWFAQPDAGALVYDACAAPGGKTVALGRAARGVIAGDSRLRRTDRLRANLARAGHGTEHVVVATAAHPPVRPMDMVMLDSPCLGTGTFARHPDARHRVSEAALEQLAATQATLLDACAGVVRPGGLLVYSTCSLEPEENVEQVDAFLRRHRDFARDPNPELPSVLLSPRGDLEVVPHRHHTDGAFAARLRREA